jgi:carboxylesterase type B
VGQNGQFIGPLVYFARGGNPNNPAVPDWPAYEVDRRATMVFDAQSKLSTIGAVKSGSCSAR